MSLFFGAGNEISTSFSFFFFFFFVSIAQETSLKKGENQVLAGTPKHWAISTGALLNEMNQGNHFLLSTRKRTPENIEGGKALLGNSWGVHNKQELLDTMNELKKNGHRKTFKEDGKKVSEINEIFFKSLLEKAALNDKVSLMILREYYPKLGKKGILGWDLSRYVLLCRWGYLAGYLTAEESWNYIFSCCNSDTTKF